MSKAKYRGILAALAAALLLAMLISTCIGNYSISPPEVIRVLLSRLFPVEKTWTDMTEGVIFTLRLPRIVGAVLVGGGLALSGAAYQGVFKNPLVSPDLLGVSQGACVGAALAILMNLGSVGVQIFAFAAGIATVMLTAAIPKLVRKDSITVLVLSGVIVSGIMNSLIGIMKYLADPETQLAEITYWQMGSLAKVTTRSLLFLAPAFLTGIIVILCVRWQINILSLGDAEAKTLGVRIGMVRGIIVLFSTLLTASAVCMCGTIGWVGLVIPHLGRMIASPDNVRSVPVSLLLGSIFMLFIDTLARALTTLELPLSILTGLIGAPFYLFILKRQRMKML